MVHGQANHDAFKAMAQRRNPLKSRRCNRLNMNPKHLLIYLKDHLAGSTGALEVLDHLVSTHAGTPLESVFKELRDEIIQDRYALEDIIRRFGPAESPIRNTGAWLGEKLARVKLFIEGGGSGPLARLEALDALALGIEGKRSLWEALEAVTSAVPPLQDVDFDRLKRRAQNHRERVGVLRLEAAREAFAGQS